MTGAKGILRVCRAKHCSYSTMQILIHSTYIFSFFLLCFRYCALVHPSLTLSIHSKRRTRKIIAGTWLISILIASPYIFCQSFSFSTESSMGKTTRQICTDRFEFIDAAIGGSQAIHSGRFRRGFFMFLFAVVYVLPSITIVTTSIRVAFRLLNPVNESCSTTTFVYRNRVVRKKEENTKKVSRCLCLFFSIFFFVYLAK